MNRLATFGEILLRLNPPGHQRISQSAQFELSVAGAEANVAVACASLGHDVFFISALPENEVADTVLRHLNFWQIDTRRVLRTGRRIGLYYLEQGFGARPSTVIYDREHSSMAEAAPELYDWPLLLRDCDWFHTTGITAALSDRSARATADGLAEARRAGLHTSFDLNYRKTLWSPERARATIEPMLPEIDLFIASPAQVATIFDCPSVGGEEAEDAEEAALAVVEKLGLRAVGLPLRKTDGDVHFRAAVWAEPGRAVRTRWLRCDILDPIGGGDAFAGGLISALMEERSVLEAAEFAVAAACLKHTIPGDFIRMKRQEIEAVARRESVQGVAR